MFHIAFNKETGRVVRPPFDPDRVGVPEGAGLLPVKQEADLRLILPPVKDWKYAVVENGELRDMTQEEIVAEQTAQADAQKVAQAESSKAQMLSEFERAKPFLTEVVKAICAELSAQGGTKVDPTRVLDAAQAAVAEQAEAAKQATLAEVKP
jgi:hypothetical protein